MNYITDYQLDIDKGFMCKVNDIPYHFDFKYSTQKHKYYISNILKLADFLEIDRSELIGIFNSDTAYNVIYCNSKQQCYELCQHIVDTYFRPTEVVKDMIHFRCDNESYTFELTLLAGKFIWKNRHDDSKPLIYKSQVDIQKVKEELSIKIYTLSNCDSFGFDSREDALKFAKFVKETFYDKKEYSEKSRRYLAKYYYNDQYGINLPERSFSLRRYNGSTWYWHNNNLKDPSNCIYSQFKLSKVQALEICNKLNLSCILHSSIPTFENPNHAVKFSDYLIETYIIKKEKTYDTNQLRKERTAISRGAKPAGSIIHGRRGKASVRCGRIEHKACLGN
jgi:hypothetical protein